ncbi:MAG: threonine synthase, partial [Parasphingorhabdus sp.]
MDYISTRGAAPALNFEQVTLAGLAGDGGLYVPQSWPSFSANEIAAMAGLSYVETAVRVMLPFVSDTLDEAELRDLCEQAYGRFS